MPDCKSNLKKASKWMLDSNIGKESVAMGDEERKTELKIIRTAYLKFKIGMIATRVVVIATSPSWPSLDCLAPGVPKYVDLVRRKLAGSWVRRYRFS